MTKGFWTSLICGGTVLFIGVGIWHWQHKNQNESSNPVNSATGQFASSNAKQEPQNLSRTNDSAKRVSNTTNGDSVPFEPLLNLLAYSTPNLQDNTRLPVFVANWRNILTSLDDVYKVKAVSDIRDRAIKNWTEKMTKANEFSCPTRRQLMRTIANGYLNEAIQNLSLLPTDDPQNEQETLLATSELRYKLGEYKLVIENVEASLNHISDARLKSQALYYLSESYLQSGDKANFRKYREMLQDGFPKEAERLCSPKMDPEHMDSLLRDVANLYASAESADDSMLKHPAYMKDYVTMRNDSISQAKEMMDQLNGDVLLN